MNDELIDTVVYWWGWLKNVLLVVCGICIGYTLEKVITALFGG